MVAAITVAGGTTHGLHTLSPAEHQAALNALTKLGTGKLGSSNLSGSAPSATQSGGSHVNFVGPSTLIGGGLGNDTFMGAAAARSSLLSPVAGGADKVVSGSTLFSHQPAQFSLGPDTVKTQGPTAVSIKPVQPEDEAKVTKTIKVGENATVTIHGVKLEH